MHVLPRSLRCSQLDGGVNEDPDGLGVYDIQVDVLTSVDIQWLIVSQ